MRRLVKGSGKIRSSSWSGVGTVVLGETPHRLRPSTARLEGREEKEYKLL